MNKNFFLKKIEIGTIKIFNKWTLVILQIKKKTRLKSGHAYYIITL